MLFPFLLAALVFAKFRPSTSSSGKRRREPKPKPKPDPKPEPKPDSEPKPNARKQAAQRLFDYVTAELAAGRSKGLGSKDKPNAQVELAQSAMGELATDGIYGPATRARGKDLIGRRFPERASKPRTPSSPSSPSSASSDPLVALLGLGSPAKAKPVTSKPSSPAKAKPSKAKPSKAKPKTPSKFEPAELDSPDVLAALALKKAVAAPEALTAVQVANWQRSIGVDPDSVLGPRSRARADELIGSRATPPWPPSSASGVTVRKLTGTAWPSDPKTAAMDLRNYVQTFAGKRPERISTYQRLIGVGVDGKVGPATKLRVRELLGEPWEATQANV